MAEKDRQTVLRTERGLTIRGTRLTLYLLLDCIKGGWTADQIKECYSLSDEEYGEIAAYISEHNAEVESEYQRVLEQAEDVRVYWTERNREHFARLAQLPPKHGKEAMYAKLREQQAEYSVE